jgi:hypothetical protein
MYLLFPPLKTCTHLNTNHTLINRELRGVLDTTLCDSLSLTCDRSFFSPGTPVPYTNKTDHHDITEIVLIVTINTINQTITLLICFEIFTISSFELATYCIGICKFHYHTYTTTTTPLIQLVTLTPTYNRVLLQLQYIFILPFIVIIDGESQLSIDKCMISIEMCTCFEWWKQ